MPAYTFRCPEGHVTELVQSIHDPLPSQRVCPEALEETELPGVVVCCGLAAARVIDAPIAVNFLAPGFYSTDVKARQQRKRRPNAGDDLHRTHDEAARRIARSL